MERCNKCGEALSIFDKINHFCIDQEIGYGSIYDTSKINLRLCCDCLDELIDSCKLNPIIDDDIEREALI